MATELTLEEVKKLLPSGRLYELAPGSKYILAYDNNAVSHKQARELMNGLSHLGIQGIVVDYDGNVTQDPFHLYEIKEASPDGHLAD